MAGLSGCVSPGPIDIGVLSRYQQAMAARGPQKRLNDDRLGVLRPAPGETGPALKVVKDPQTGKARIHLTLQDAVTKALANSADIHVASLDPAISHEQVVQAAAAFDYVVFGQFSYQKDDNRSDSTFGGGKADTRVYEAGIKQYTVTGAEWSLASMLTRSWDNQAFRRLPTRWESNVTFRLTQPLLRNAWGDFALASLRIARVNRKITMAAFRQEVEGIVTETISTYWALVQARKEAEILQRLLEKTQETLEQIKLRVKLDVTKVEIKQTEAAVALRKAALLRARKVIVDAEQRLARLLSDSQLNALSDFEIVPLTPPATTPVVIDPGDQMLAALRHNPQLEQARLAIEAYEVNVRVAKNQTLPKLDLSGSIGLQGLDAGRSDAVDDLYTGNYLSWSFSLVFEYPLGNREASAGLRRARFERMKSIASMQDTADRVAVAIRERMRQIDMAFEEIQVNREAVEAARVQLQGLEETERIRGRLTPEFLQVKLQAQGTIASAEQGESRAIVDYNTAIVDLHRTTGTVLQRHRVQVALPVATGEKDWPSQQPSSAPSTQPEPVIQIKPDNPDK